ncbi:MAG: Rrf2 family transcriptional regulator [Proteobacteria bacterium]|nr:Rrf2 family transcriptional regulator [Pseudomonadota bacterium]
MLSISSKCRYGIAAVLALTENYGRGLLQIRDIASRKDVPRQYLEQIFNRLVNAGIVKSVRGKKGGYQLAVAPVDLTILMIIDVLEGGIQLTGDNFNTSDAVHHMFQRIEVELKGLLQTNFAELEVEQQSLHTDAMYHI